MLTSRWRINRKKPKPRALYGNLIAYMQDRLAEQPSDLRLRLSLVAHLKMAGRYEEAIYEARQILRLHPGNRRAKSLLLRLRLEQRLTGIRRVS